MTDLLPHLTGRAHPVRVNWSRWVSDCSGLLCLNAWQVQPGDTRWVCNLCGSVTDLRWPPDPAAIELILSMRPDPHTRNWAPPETVTDLLAENIAHGVTPPEVAALIGGPDTADLLTVIDGRATSGALLPNIVAARQDLAARTAIRALER